MGGGFGSEELAGEVGVAAVLKSGEVNKLPGARFSLWHPRYVTSEAVVCCVVSRGTLICVCVWERKGERGKREGGKGREVAPEMSETGKQEVDTLHTLTPPLVTHLGWICVVSPQGAHSVNI